MKFKITQEKFPEVVTVFSDGPAAMAQLKARDIITQVDGCPTNDLGKEEIYRMLIGKPATKSS